MVFVLSEIITWVKPLVDSMQNSTSVSAIAQDPIYPRENVLATVKHYYELEKK